MSCVPVQWTRTDHHLDDATTDADLRVPPSNHFEKLKGALADWHSIRVNEQWRLVFRWHGGNLKDFHSIRINDQWRVIFKWINGEPHEVRIVDYH